VALAPIEAPRFTRVGENWSGVGGKAARGLRTLVKTMFGPRKTSSSMVTPFQTSTLFFTMTRLPSFAPLSMKAWSHTLQSAATVAERTEGALQVDRCRVMDGRLDARGAELREHIVPPGHAHHVEMPDRLVPRQRRGEDHAGDAGQQRVIAAGGCAALRVPQR